MNTYKKMKITDKILSFIQKPEKHKRLTTALEVLFILNR